MRGARIRRAGLRRRPRLPRPAPMPRRHAARRRSAWPRRAAAGRWWTRPRPSVRVPYRITVQRASASTRTAAGLRSDSRSSGPATSAASRSRASRTASVATATASLAASTRVEVERQVATPEAGQGAGAHRRGGRADRLADVGQLDAVAERRRQRAGRIRADRRLIGQQRLDGRLDGSRRPERARPPDRARAASASEPAARRPRR